MSRSTPAAPSPSRSRRWRVPPPLTRNGELLEGSDVLTEVPGQIAILLWKSLRSVTLWAAAAPQDQDQLFAPGSVQRRIAEILASGVEPPLREPLEALASLLADPRHASREAVALACRQIAQWAAGRAAHGTELAFTQAAALALPVDAELAFQVGRLTRARGEIARAESWYRRAIMLGRQTGNWTAYARSFLGLGIAARRRGNLPLARRSHLKALRVAGRHGLAEVRAMALHELFTVSVECDDASTAQRYAEQAFHAYGARHRYVRYLANDVCCLWMREGEFQRALPVLRSLQPLLVEAERLLPAANLVRAAGGAGDRLAFEAGWADALALIDSAPAPDAVPSALLSIARGATGVGEWERAAEAAERALAAATAAGQAQNVFEAESVLAFVRSRRAVESNATRTTNEPVEHDADRLAEEMVASFSALAAV